MVLYKGALRTAVPVEAFGKGSHQLPEGDLAWVHTRVQGLHLVLAFAYFDYSIGLTGKNMDKLHRINLLRDGGRRSVIVCGDFTCDPTVWEESGLFEPLGFSVVTAGPEHTCKTSSGSSLLD